MVKSHNIIDITWLQAISSACSDFQSGQVFRAIYFTGLFCISTTLQYCTSLIVKIILKWSKTIQTRDKVVFLSLPKLSDHLICPFRALKSLFKAYPMSSETSLFQINTSQGSNPVTDSNVRKTLKNINIKSRFFHFS